MAYQGRHTLLVLLDRPDQALVLALPLNASPTLAGCFLFLHFLTCKMGLI